MIIAWIIGLILCIITIYLLKHTVDYCNNSILKVWHLLILLIVAIIPIANIILSFVIIYFLILGYRSRFYELRAGNKIKGILNLLNKRI